MTRRITRNGWRQLTLLAALLAFSCLIAQHLFYWQVSAHARVAQVVNRINNSESDIPAMRGSIVDSNWQTLAAPVSSWRVAADPQWIASHEGAPTAARALAPLLHQPYANVLKVLTTPGTEYVVVAQGVDDATAQAIRALKLTGLILTSDWRTTYPQGSLAAAVLGFVNASGQGRYGLEYEYNSILAGRPGVEFTQPDITQRQLTVGVEQPRAPVNGATLQLTLNASIQHAVEQRLAEEVKKTHAASASAVVMDPHTGAILAMASVPTFDPNNYAAYPYSAYNNQALSLYQPGSTFKIVSVSTGLDTHSFSPWTTIDDPGYVYFYGAKIENWKKGVGWGVETPEKMLRYSANVGMAKFVHMIDPGTYYDYLLDHFGFGQATGIDLPNDVPSVIRTPTNNQGWSPIDQITNSYGQGINVTPLQLTTAVAALANGGLRMRPYLVQKIVNPDNTVRWTARPHVVARAVSPATAATMTNILMHSALDGEATCALTPGYKVAAKTGTATIEGPVATGLDVSQGTVASLIGYAPADNPRFAMLIQVTDPKPGPDGQHIYGSVTAAPVWHDVAEQIYNILKIPPEPAGPDVPTQAQLAQLQGPTDWACEFDKP